MTTGLVIHTKAQTCNQALELIPEEPFEFFEENGESFGILYPNTDQVYIGISWPDGSQIPDSFLLATGTCGNLNAIAGGKVFETPDNFVYLNFTNLTAGQAYKLGLFATQGQSYTLFGYLTESISTTSTCLQANPCNFITNPGFEDPDPTFQLPVGGSIQSGMSQPFWALADEACGWQRANNHPNSTPEYFLAQLDPSYGFCQQTGIGNVCGAPGAGNSYGAIQLYTIDQRPNNVLPNRREYVYTEYPNGFIQGTGLYALRTVVRHDPDRAARCGALQAKFESNYTPVTHPNIITSLGTPEADLSPYIDLNNGGWQTVWHLFSYNGPGANQMILGNFLDNSATQNYMNNYTANTPFDHIPALFIDNVALFEMPSAGPDITVCEAGTPITLGYDPPCGTIGNITCTWRNQATQQVLQTASTAALQLAAPGPGSHIYELEITFTIADPFNPGNPITRTITDLVTVNVAPDLDATPLAADNCAKDAAISIPNLANWIAWNFTSPNGSVTWSSAPKVDLSTNRLIFLAPQVTAHNGVGLVNGTVTFTYNGIVCTQNIDLGIYDCCQSNQQNNMILPDGANLSTVLAGTQLSNTVFTVYGTVTIDDNFTFNACEFYLMPDAALEIAAGIDVTFTDCSLQACADYKWDRIWHNQPTSTLTMNGCLIRDALRGINSTNNAQLLLNSNRFTANAFGQIIENYTGNLISWTGNAYEVFEAGYQTSQHPNSTINLAPYLVGFSPVNGFGISMINASSLELNGNNTFWCNTIDNNLQLWLRSGSYVRVEQNNFYEGLNIRVEGASTLEAYNNTFEKLNTSGSYGPTGIRAYNSTLVVGKPGPGNPPWPPSNQLLDGAFIVSEDPELTEIINNKIENLIGICIDILANSLIQSQTKIQHNELRGRWGINLENLETDWSNPPTEKVLVNFNSIFATRYDNQNHNGTQAMGISAWNCEGISIGENLIVLENALGVSPPDANNYHLTVGIELTDCRNPFIGCNCINFAGIGLELGGDVDKDSWNTLANGFALNFQANEFGSCYYGIYLNPQTTMPNAIGESGLAADNTWTAGCYFGPPMTTVERIKDDRNNLIQFTYHRTNLNPNTHPNPTSQGIFVNSNALTANDCTQAPPPSNKKEIENDMEHKSSQLNVFPNPAKDILSIDIQTPSIRGSYQLSVYNYVGQIVHSAEYLDHRIELPIEQLPSGIYIIKVEIQGKEIVSRFIKK